MYNLMKRLGTCAVFVFLVLNTINLSTQ
jgi:hypothetical protein